VVTGNHDLVSGNHVRLGQDGIEHW
jgi:hypothetical protein